MSMPTTERAAELDVLVACSALSGATARLAVKLQSSSFAWRERGRSLVVTATTLVGDTGALRAVRSPTLRRQQVARIGDGADDATAAAMRLHNLLPPGDAAFAAFDVAACAAAVSVAVRALDMP